ncbi:MAG: hypothetical protein CML13_13335 [Puniceicoccaceae bacterium]|nr:hypothetical protein [Puniceicoccaceae bacterium]|tara:strand:+ start:13771 stop:17274 length:3504 start_codon:yes stop_codon:yes gene_type:complete
MKRILSLFTLLLLAVTSLPAQFEDLFQSEESDPEFIAKKAAEAERERKLGPIQLVAPTLHSKPVLGADLSADGTYLLTYDEAVLKVWDTAQRVPLVEKNFTDESNHPNASMGRIRGAYFTGQANQICVVTAHDVRFYDDLIFKEPSDRSYANRTLAHRFFPKRKSLYLIQSKGDYPRDSSKTLQLVVRKIQFNGDRSAEIVTETSIPGSMVDVTGRNSNQREDWQLTISPDSTALLFYTGPESPTLLLSLIGDDKPTALAAEKGIIGFMPDAQLVCVQKNENGYTLSIRPDSVEEAVEIARFSEPKKHQRLAVHIPDDKDELLTAASSTTFLTYDPAQKSNSGPIQLTGQFLEAATKLPHAKNSEQLLLLRAKEGSRSFQRFQATRGLLAGQWTTLAWSPERIFSLPERFQFIAQSGRTMRLLEIVDNGIHSRSLPALPEGKVLCALAAPAGSEHWYYFFTNAQYAKLDPKQPDQALELQNLAPSRFTHSNGYSYSLGSSVTPDQRYVALHYGTQVVVFDTKEGKVIANPQFPRNIAVSPSAGSMVALSHDGKLLAYGYGTAQDGTQTHHLTVVDLVNEQVRWTQQMEQGFIHNLGFFDNGQQLFASDSYNRRSVRFDTRSGEQLSQPASFFAGEKTLQFSARGDQYFTASKNKIQQYTLPGSRFEQSIETSNTPDFFAPLGGERFILSYQYGRSSLQLSDLAKGSTVADLYLFEAPDKWLVRNAETGLFTSSQDAHNHLFYVRSDTINPLAAYFEQFYRPRLLGSLINGLSLKPTMDLEKLRYAPRLTLAIDGPQQRGLTVEDEFETVEVPEDRVILKINTSCEGSPIEDIRIYQNGKLVTGGTRGLFVEDDEDLETNDIDEMFTKEASFTFPLAEGRNRFRAIAINAQGTESIPDEVIVYSAGAEATATAGIALHLCVIGINEYANPDYNLNYAQADATAVQSLLQAQSQNIFSRTQVYTLLNKEATRENIIATLENIKAEANPRDVFIFYYAGHGVVSVDTNAAFYLAPTDIKQLYGNADQLRNQGISSQELLEYSRDIAAQKQLFILDACQSEGALKTVAQRGAAEEEAIAQLARSTGTHWLTATASDQTATEFETLGHGAFTYTLIEALKGAADSGDGIISVNELKAYIETRVPEVTAEHKGEVQYPASYGYGQDFPIALSK